MNVEAILEIAWDYYAVPHGERDRSQASVGWEEIKQNLGVGRRHAQHLIRLLEGACPEFLERYLNFTYAAIPPDKMSVFYTGPERAEEHWDDLGRTVPQLCTPKTRATWRELGGPYFLRVVDVGARYSTDLLEEYGFEDGDMPIVDCTRATLIPICLEKGRLILWNEIRRAGIPRKRARARRGQTDSNAINKSPIFKLVSPLLYAQAYIERGVRG